MTAKQLIIAEFLLEREDPKNANDLIFVTDQVVFLMEKYALFKVEEFRNFIHADVEKVKSTHAKRVEAARKVIEEGCKMEAEIENLKKWKRAAAGLLDALNIQGIGKELGVCLGKPIAPEVLPAIRALKAEVEQLRNGIS